MAIFCPQESQGQELHLFNFEPLAEQGVLSESVDSEDEDPLDFLNNPDQRLSSTDWIECENCEIIETCTENVTAAKNSMLLTKNWTLALTAYLKTRLFDTV